jgi:hypothetical protein
MPRRSLAALPALLLAMTSPALAQAPDPRTIFPGQAQTGPDQRGVRFVISCSTTRTATATGVLSIELYIPQYEQLAASFDFEALEGPDAHAGKLSHLETRAAATTPNGSTSSGTTASGDFEVSGWAAVDADAPFGLGLNAAVRGEPVRLSAVARLLRPLTLGAGQLVWRQGNPRKGGTPIVATLSLADADAARLRMIISPCLALAK